MNKYLDKAGLQEYTTKLTAKYDTRYAKPDDFGSPLVAATAADMTDHDKVYVYVGSETGYTSGNWYYWNGTAWASGGVYNSTAFVTDTTLTQAGKAADAKATGDALADVESYITKEQAVTLPSNVVGKCKISTPAAGDEIISGTHNVASLLQIKEGTFTPNGLTIVVTGNTVQMSGTASASTYFSLVDGEAVTAATLAAMTCPLPEHSYTLSTKAIQAGDSTTYPSLQIRGKSSGAVVTSQNNTAQFTMDESTCGGSYLYFQKDKTFNLTYVVAVFPYATDSSNAHREETSNITEYTSGGVYNLDGYTWGIGTASVTYISPIIKKPKCRYYSTSIPYSKATEILDVYIPTEAGYIDYVMGHGYSVADKCDVWLLVQIDEVTDYFGFVRHITQQGETEMAIKIQGRDDFIGGATHGDEVMVADSFVVLLDGGNTDITTITTLSEFETLKMFIVSTLYDPDDHTTVVGEHGREWLFDSEGLTLSQTVAFSENLTLVGSYMPMVCAIRGNDSVSAEQITDTYIDDGNFQNYDVGTGGFTTYPNQLKNDVRSINLFGKTSKIDIRLELIEEPEGLTGEGVYLFNGVNTYNKIYCAICGYNNATQAVTSGDKWKVKSKLTVNVGK